MNNKKVLNQLTNEQEKVVFKGMRDDMETGKALLNPEQLGKFLRYATLPNTILSAADFKLMKSFKKNLNRTSIDGRVLESGYKTDGKTTNPDITKADVKFDVEELDAKKLKAMCEIEDDEKEDNLEQSQFENTLLSMMGERIGEDLEFWSLFGDKTITYATNSLLSTTDGWLKKAGQKLVSAEVNTTTNDFDLADGVEAMFDKMLEKFPKRFMLNRNDLSFYVPFEVEDAYRNVLKSRGTALGDTTQTGYAVPINYKGIPIKHCHTFDAEDGRGLDDTATSILVNPKNMAYGIWKNVSIEPKRIVEEELTQYWYRMRGDVNYYFPEASVTSKITTDEAALLPAASKT